MSNSAAAKSSYQCIKHREMYFKSDVQHKMVLCVCCACALLVLVAVAQENSNLIRFKVSPVLLVLDFGSLQMCAWCLRCWATTY